MCDSDNHLQLSHGSVCVPEMVHCSSQHSGICLGRELGKLPHKLLLGRESVRGPNTMITFLLCSPHKLISLAASEEVMISLSGTINQMNGFSAVRTSSNIPISWPLLHGGQVFHRSVSHMWQSWCRWADPGLVGWIRYTPSWYQIVLNNCWIVLFLM